LYQCLGSGSVGSARFWLPGSGSTKICGSTDPDPRGKKSTKNCKKKTLILNPKSELLKEREIIQISSFLNGSSSFRIKISENLKEMTGSIFFFSTDPGSGSASKLNESYALLYTFFCQIFNDFI